MKTNLNNETGALPLFVLLAALGLVAFFAISNTFQFRSALFETLYPKPQSQAIEQKDVKKLSDDALGKTKELQKLTVEYSQLPEDLKPQKISEIKKLAEERKKLMLDLADNDPDSFLQASVSKASKKLLPQDVAGDIEDLQSIEGTWVISDTDNFEKKLFGRYEFIVDSNKQKTHIKFGRGFQKPSDFQPGVTAKITGFKLDDKFVVGGLDGSVEVSGKDVKGVTNVFNTIVYIFRYTNDSYLPDEPWSADQLRRMVFTDPNSVKAFHLENSLDKYLLVGARDDLSGDFDQATGDVYAYVSLPSYPPNSSTIPVLSDTACTDLTGISMNEWLRPFAQSIPNVSYSQYQKVIYIVPTPADRNYQCSIFSSGNNYVVKGTSQEIFINTPEAFVISHEVGHSLGALHTYGYQCVDSNYKAVPVSDNCTIYSLADPYDIMSGDGNIHHFSSFNKELTGILAPANIQQIQSDNEVTIYPIDVPTTNTQVVKIPRDQNIWGQHTSFYYIELRQANSTFENFTYSFVTDGVSIRLAPIYDSDVFERNYISALIDTTPGSSYDYNDSALGKGSLFEDLYGNISGIRVEVTDLVKGTAQNPGYAKVKISFVPGIGGTGIFSALSSSMYTISSIDSPPTVKFTNPTQGALVPSAITISLFVSVVDDFDTNIPKLEYYVNGRLICSFTMVGGCSWKVPNKPGVIYTLEAKAYDSKNQVGSDKITVTSR